MRKIGDVVTKTLPATITKADNGSFDALVSPFGNVDEAGDMVVAGAFTETLTTKFADRPIPVVWSHDSWTLRSFIGKATAEESETGLVVHSDYFDHEDAQLARFLMTEGVVVEFSWSGIIRDAHVEQIDGDYIYVITRVELLEVGPTLAGMNRDTELIGVKSVDAAKAGTADEQLRALMLQLVQDEVARALGAATPTPEQPGTEPGEATKSVEQIEAFATPKTKARLALSTLKEES